MLKDAESNAELKGLDVDPLVMERTQLPGRAKLAFALPGVLIFALALFGNALVVYVVTRSEAMRTVTNIFTCSLALSDLPIAFFCMPVTMLQNIFNNWLRDMTGLKFWL
eukprot:bmy_17161T0